MSEPTKDTKLVGYDRADMRAAALEAAMHAHPPGANVDAILAAADQFYAWLIAEDA